MISSRLGRELSLRDIPPDVRGIRTGSGAPKHSGPRLVDNVPMSRAIEDAAAPPPVAVGRVDRKGIGAAVVGGALSSFFPVRVRTCVSDSASFFPSTSLAMGIVTDVTDVASDASGGWAVLLRGRYSIV